MVLSAISCVARSTSERLHEPLCSACCCVLQVVWPLDLNVQTHAACDDCAKCDFAAFPVVWIVLVGQLLCAQRSTTNLLAPSACHDMTRIAVEL